MSRYLISRNEMSSRDNFNIRNDNYYSVYEAKQAYSIVQNRIELYPLDEYQVDGNKIKVAELVRVINLIVPEYEIRIEGYTSLRMKHKIGFTTDYSIEGDNVNWVLRSSGNRDVILDSNEEIIFEIRSYGTGVFNREYEVENKSDYDDLFGICFVIALDCSRRALRRM